MPFISQEKTNLKYVLIVIVLATIVGGGILWLSMRQELSPRFSEIKRPEKIIEDETAGWKTYRNEEYRYEVKYPGGYNITDDSKYPRTVAFGKSLEYNIFITVYEEPTVLGFQGTWGSMFQSKTDQEIISSEDIEVNGVTFRKNYWSPGPTTITVYTTHKQNVYTLSFGARNENLEPETAIFNQILSTFRFIETEDESAKGPYIKLISPNGGEEWIKGKNYTINWDQKGLERWGNEATICLEGFNNERNIILPKERREAYCFLYESYLVTVTTLTDNTYQWMIPEDISEKFEEPPSFYKLNLMVVDALQSEGRTEWAGRIESDESDDYFKIVGTDETANWKIYWNEEYRFEIKYPDGWEVEDEKSFYSMPFVIFRFKPGCMFTVEVLPEEHADYDSVERLKKEGYEWESIVIADISGTMFEYEMVSSPAFFYSRQTSIYFYKENNLYRITRTVKKEGEWLECIDTSDQILSTFKFIEP